MLIGDLLSREYRGEKIVIFPVYLDSKASRSEGRRVPLRLAVPSPTIREIVDACIRLGLNPVVEDDKIYPRNPSTRGRVIVDKRGKSKLEILNAIASELKNIRGITK